VRTRREDCNGFSFRAPGVLATEHCSLEITQAGTKIIFLRTKFHSTRFTSGECYRSMSARLVYRSMSACIVYRYMSACLVYRSMSACSVYRSMSACLEYRSMSACLVYRDIAAC
jgi:hypothetical protein